MERQALSREDAGTKDKVTQVSWPTGTSPLSETETEETEIDSTIGETVIDSTVGESVFDASNADKVATANAAATASAAATANTTANADEVALQAFDTGTALRIMLVDRRLATYTYRASHPEAEVRDLNLASLRAPRPIWQFLDAEGREITDRFPVDHPWHEGLSLAIAHVNQTNFWGGPTYLSGTDDQDAGYQQLDNLGSQSHLGMTVDVESASTIRITEQLEWLDERVLPLFTETREMTVTVNAAAQSTPTSRLASKPNSLPPSQPTLHLTWHSILRNVTPGTIHLGSPQTNGRAGAGYGGIFLRLADDYRAGELLDANGNRGESVAQGHAGWLRQDSTDASRPSVTLRSVDAHPTWFVRSEEYPGLGPAPFAEHETTIGAGEILELQFEMTVEQDEPTNQDAEAQS